MICLSAVEGACCPIASRAHHTEGGGATMTLKLGVTRKPHDFSIVHEPDDSEPPSTNKVIVGFEI